MDVTQVEFENYVSFTESFTKIDVITIDHAGNLYFLCRCIIC